MNANITLKSIFASSKEDLSKKLSNLSLPKDSQQIQLIVSEYLNNIFESEGAFRQNLTESEDYLLQASLRLLQAQQNITVEFIKASKDTTPSIDGTTERKNSDSSRAYLSAVGAGVGALAGSVIATGTAIIATGTGNVVIATETWAAVAGAIAGTALIIYSSTRSNNNKDIISDKQKENPAQCINPDTFCNIVEKICENFDGVIDTYRIQVKRISNSYEQREKPSLLNTYSSLSDQIANVIQVSKNSGNEIPSRLKNAILIMEDSLENYDLKFDNGKILNN